MPAPSVTSVVYDKSAYNPGDLMTVTVTGIAGSSITTHTGTGTATFTDTSSGLSGSLAGNYAVTSAVEDVTTAAFTDDQGRLYAQKSLAQTPAGLVTAVWTATA
jgi:hypothetical protein